MRIFIDTSALYALLDGDDNNHAKAKKAWGEIRRRGGGQIEEGRGSNLYP